MSTYHINPDKLTEIVNTYAEYEPNVATADVEATLTYDWHGGQEHQDWLDTAPAAEIADWLAAQTFEDIEAD